MNANLLDALVRCHTDLEGALYRFFGDERLYVHCCREFLHDQTVYMLRDAFKEQQWNDAFTAAHALKGLAGNMGFVPLYMATAKLVVQIRIGRIGEAGESYQEIVSCYDRVSKAIRENGGITATR